MTPFMQFRLWAREGPAAERVLTVVAAALALALLVWALAPASGTPGGSDVAATAGPSTTTPAGDASTGAVSPTAAADASVAAPGAAASTGTGGAASAQPSSATPAGSAARATAGATDTGGAEAVVGGGCDNRATDTGVTKDTIKVGYLMYSLGDANALIHLPTPDQSKKQFQALIDQYNKAGGVQCRKLAPVFYEDTLNAPAEHSLCLQAQQDGIFVMIADLFTPQERNCLAAAKVPNFTISPPTTPNISTYFPYVISHRADTYRIMRDYVFGSREYHFFDGMKKLGVLDSTCYPDLQNKMYEYLAAVGIPKNTISRYNYGCPSQTSTPDQDTAAALQFKREGVTHVMGNYYNWPTGFARAAGQQAYKPKYSIMDDNTWSLVQNADPPVDPNLDGALGITKDLTGAENVPGYQWNAATQDCIKLTTALGLESPVKAGVTAIYGSACAMVKMFVEAAKVTSPLTRTGLVNGVAKLGKVDLSYPAGPADFHDPKNPTGAQSWRAGIYRNSCTCFQFVDGAYRPEFR